MNVPQVGSGLTLEVFLTLKDDILNGRYGANETLPVEQICQELEVSRSPIMAALRLLADRGLVVIQPQVGCRVASFSETEVRDFLRIFASTESALAELAAERRSEEHLARMASAIERLAQAREAEDLIAARHCNREFHSLMHEAAQTRLMSDQSNRMWDIRDVIIRTSNIPRMPQVVAHFDHEHTEIIEALRNEDVARARALVEHHVYGVLDFLHPSADFHISDALVNK